MRKLIAICLFALLLPMSARADWERTLVPDPDNPVFHPATRAYYPTVLYDADGFGAGDAGPFYRIWYSDGADISTAESDDGIVWSGETVCVGLTNPHHSKVIYDANGFGNGVAGPFYKMWYWDTANLYDISAIRYAESDDGVSWVNDQALTQDACPDCLIDNILPVKWNRGSYGPVFILYNVGASNSGTDPFDYSYAMYYDGTTGGFEQTGLGYSADGTHWTIAEPDPVLPSGSDWEGAWGLPDPWDSSYSAFGTVIRDSDGLWHFWYSGGTTAIHEGIGHATSSDGIIWVRDDDNPIIVPVNGTWIQERAYTPTVLYDPDRYDGHGDNSQYKMWISGRDGSGNYTVGYYGRSVATLTVDLGEQSPSTVNVEASPQSVVILQLKLTNDDVEPVDFFELDHDDSGTVMNADAIDSVAVYWDVEGDGRLDEGTDPLLGEASAAAESATPLDASIEPGEEQYWIVVVKLNENASVGDAFQLLIDTADYFVGSGVDTGEMELVVNDVPYEGLLQVVESPSPPSPEPIVEGGGGCGCNMGAGPTLSGLLPPLVIFALFVALIVLRLRRIISSSSTSR